MIIYSFLLGSISVHCEEEPSSKVVSLELKGADILDVFKILSQQSGLSIVSGVNVRGNVTLYLRDVSVWDAFTIIVESNNLAYERKGGLIKVMTDADYERIYGKRFYDMRKTATQTKVFVLNYARAKEIKEKLADVVTKGVGGIYFDERTNTVIVTDLIENMDRITTFINSFDRKDMGVLIEAKIVQVLLSDEYKLGVDWDALFTGIDAKSSGKFDIVSESFGGTFAVGTVPENGYAAAIKALQTIGKTNTLSNPRIAVINNQEAKILVGTKEAYVTASVTQSTTAATTAESVTFIDVGVNLTVTPYISSEGFITMKIKPDVSSVDRTITTSQKNTIPIVRTSQAETQVVLKDGTTIIIAGLIEDKESNIIRKIPFLGDIPFLGSLFRGKHRTINKSELAIFLTPHIIRDKPDET